MIFKAEKEDGEVFKSSFAKYLTAFVVIILTSFVILSSIITSMIRSYVTAEKDDKLALTTYLVIDSLSEIPVENVSAPNYLDEVAGTVQPIINFDSRYDMILLDNYGTIRLTTLEPECIDESGNKKPLTDFRGGFGIIDTEEITAKEHSEGEGLYVYNGDLGGYLKDRSLVYTRKLTVDGSVKGYVLSLSSTEVEDKLVALTRSVVINSSVWVLLAAVIAAYFITERMIHPLKNMTSASKKFAKGDFSARITVYGKDEVAELGNAFNNMAESLDSLEKMRNSFLANVSHDLRTPMTTISGFIDGITSGAIPPEKHEYYLGVISQEVHRLNRLVTQLLDISRMESGERKFNFASFDVCEVSRIILISFEQKIEDKRLDVEFDCDEDTMYALGDKDAIHQVIYNLCHNAIKFSREGGKFRISIKRADGKINVSVFDEGESVGKEDIKQIFDRFFKTDKSRGLDKSGVGLGLYICKTIIDAHGENISANSVEGESTEFRFTLKEGATPQKRKERLSEDKSWTE